MDDLFGHVPQKGELFQGARPVVTPHEPMTPEKIRIKALAALAEARAAATMPWDARTLRSRTAMFPYWAEWLKHGEGERLLKEFKAEMDRLHAPADQVAPNWREMWGIPA